MRPNIECLSRSLDCSRSSASTVLRVFASASGRFAISLRISRPSHLTADVSERNSCAIIRLPADGVLAVINWPRASVERNELAASVPGRALEEVWAQDLTELAGHESARPACTLCRA